MTARETLDVFDKNQPYDRRERPRLVRARRSAGDEKAGAGGIANHAAVEVELQGAFQDEPHMSLLAPLGFDELGGEFHQANLPGALSIYLEARARQGRLPFEGFEVNLEARHRGRQRNRLAKRTPKPSGSAMVKSRRP